MGSSELQEATPFLPPCSATLRPITKPGNQALLPLGLHSPSPHTLVLETEPLLELRAAVCGGHAGLEHLLRRVGVVKEQLVSLTCGIPLGASLLAQYPPPV